MSKEKKVSDVELTNPAGPDNKSRYDSEDFKFGYFGWKPDWIQRINRPVWLLVFMSVYAFIQGLIINGFVNVSISTLEKRFDLPSSRTGLIASSYDISSATLVVFVSYYGGKGHKARWLGFGCLIFAVGAIVYGLPHFTTGQHTNTSGSLVCVADSTNECKESNLANYFYVFVLSQVLHGIGVTPLYSIGVTLIDESVSHGQSALYLGIFYALAAFGPGVGYVVGGAILNIYTDLEVDVDSLGLTPDDPGWVGAWWLGLIVGGVIAIVIAIPILGLPAEFPGTQALRESKVSQAHAASENEKVSTAGFGTKLSDFPKAVSYLIRNPPYVCFVLIGCCEGLITSGMSTFGPKLIETQFGLDASSGALYFGVCAIPGAGLGTWLGGYLTKRWQLKVRGMIKFSIIATVISLAGLFCLLVRCDQELVVGVNVDYYGNKMNIPNDEMLVNDCNTNCGCTRSEFKPVCGDNGLEYFDACFAGCTDHANGKDFTGCSCLQLASNSSSSAVDGKCAIDNCNMLPVFLGGLIIVMVFHFMAAIPGVSCILRCVPDSQRSLAVGVQWIFIRALGTIPGPIIFGAALDSSCLLWQQDCSGTEGSCFLYSGSGISWKFTIINISFVSIALIMWLSALCLYQVPDGVLEDEKAITQDNMKDVKLNHLVSSGSKAGIVENEALPPEYTYDNSAFDACDVNENNSSSNNDQVQRVHSVSQV